MPYHSAAFYTEGPALFIFISALDEGFKNTMIKFADSTKAGGKVSTLEKVLIFRRIMMS